MMVLMTGSSGTVAPAMRDHIIKSGGTVTAWNRALTSSDNLSASRQFMEMITPQVIVHLGMGSPDWAECLARYSADASIPFLFTSTVSVFQAPPQGPYTIESVPNAVDDYGRYKRECETRIRKVNPNAHIVRIGWQIGSQRGGNQMVEFICREQDAKGRVDANCNWLPACSLLEDTAAGLWNIFTKLEAGTYLLDSNPYLPFSEIVNRLNDRLQLNLTVNTVNGPVLDNRMDDPRTQDLIRPLSL